MKRRTAGVLLLALAVVSCGPSPTGEATPSSASATSSPAAGSVVGTVIRFSTGSVSLDVTIGEDNPAARDFLSMLPLTLTMEEFAGREKIADLPRPLHYEGSPGSDPEDGDLIYFVPWGNLGLYYNTSGIGFSDQTIHLGRYNATPDELARFEDQEVRVEVSP
ncbi:cyclophilin-like fold protein [Paenarthrobacter sp. TA1.8]|uniref:cyclophilin-like fold protein n=1 Tax=Paenarthrobacter sp. TA1.8 TaxID=3400219 RepID=UPI003B4334A8